MQHGNEEATLPSNRLENEEVTLPGGQFGNEEATLPGGQFGTGEATLPGGQWENGDATLLGGQWEESNASGQAPGWNSNLFLGLHEQVGDYKITGFIKKSGEAELYTAEKDDKEYVYKLYLGEYSLKQEVVEKLRGKEFKHVAQMLEFGEQPITNRRGETIKKRYEVMPKYKNVSMPVPYAELKRLIAEVNEGLRELHDLDIYHKDIKPANILLDENDTYRIIDFGISTVGDDGKTIRTEQGGMTKLYASPEQRKNDKIHPAGDYYSFGISLYEFFTGKFPYDEYADNRDRLNALEESGIKVRESQGIPTDLEKLLHGLTFYNSNPEINKKRWGYEQVKQWLENPELLEAPNMEELIVEKKKHGPVHEKATVGFEEPYYFNTKEIKYFDAAGNELSEKSSSAIEKAIPVELKLFDSYTLANAMGRYWEDGQDEVGRGYMQDFFKKLGGEFKKYANACIEAENVLDNDDPDKWQADLTYWNLIYLIEPNMDRMCWRTSVKEGRAFTCEEFGVEYILDSLKNNPKFIRTLERMMDSGMLKSYLKFHLKDEKRLAQLERLEREDWKKDKEKAAWKIGYLFAGKAMYFYRDRYFSGINELYRYIVEWTNSLTKQEALAVAKDFEASVEFLAWKEWEEEEKR